MKISLNWLNDFVDLSGVAAERVAELLSLHTAEVEGVERFGAGIREVLVGEVVECGRHPDADKLSLTRVEFGGGEAVQVVCGANNVRKGLKVAFAPVGTTLPGGLKLKKAKLRGQASHGMICSERELELSDEHAGILELPDDAPVGEPLLDYLELSDWVLELDNKSLTHRPDLWGHYGFARELAAILGRELKPLPVRESWPDEAAAVAITLEDPESCPLYLGLPVDLGGAPREAPLWVRRRLLAVGQRPISDVVDLTNYVLQEIGQPTHAFDLALLEGPAICVRRALDGEQLTTLDGQTRELTGEDLLIGDGGRGVALAGVMGGADTEVGESTRRILLESAWFAPARVRRTSQRLALRTEASTRFEKCLDPGLAEQALRRFAHLLERARPEATVLAAPARAGEAAAPAITLELDPQRTAQLLGVELGREEVAAPLQALGFGVADRNGSLEVAVPSWRAGKDVTQSIDLVEEVGRLHGYDRVQPRVLDAPVRPPWIDPVRMLARRLSDRLAHAHRAYETQGYSFLDAQWPARLGLPREAFVTVHNPVQTDVDLVRRDPMPSLLGQAVENLAERERGTLFEVGKGYEPAADALPRERHWLAAVTWGPESENVDGPNGVFGRARAIVEDLLRTAGLTADVRVETTVEKAMVPWCHPARGLHWQVDGRSLAFGGAMDPRLGDLLGVRRASLAGLMLDLAALSEHARPSGRRFRAPARFPAVKVDVALALPESVPYAEVESALRRAGGKVLESLTLFDLFRGGTLADGERSLAFHAVLRAADRTLSDKDEHKFLERAGKAAVELGGKLRS